MSAMEERDVDLEICLKQQVLDGTCPRHLLLMLQAFVVPICVNTRRNKRQIISQHFSDNEVTVVMKEHHQECFLKVRMLNVLSMFNIRIKKYDQSLDLL